MKIIKKHDWYDPEGLNIPSPKDIVFEGTKEECDKKLNEMHDNYENEYKTRDDISVYPIKNNQLRIYYCSAIAWEKWMIVD